jgi:hypothetical protein
MEPNGHLMLWSQPAQQLFHGRGTTNRLSGERDDDVARLQSRPSGG